MSALQPQFRTGEWTFLLDGRVVEAFFEGTAGSTRFHVDHLRIDARPDEGGLAITWGIEVAGQIVNGGRAKIAADRIAAFQDFVAQAIANRTA